MVFSCLSVAAGTEVEAGVDKEPVEVQAITRKASRVVTYRLKDMIDFSCKEYSYLSPIETN